MLRTNVCCCNSSHVCFRPPKDPALSASPQVELPRLEILDLRHFSSHSLRPVLEAESRVWGERLDWDYRASIQLLMQYLDARVLPGFVAIEDNQVIGYTFCVYEDRKAVVGDVFARPGEGSGYTAREVEATLLHHLLALLQNSPGVERIESQLLLHAHELHAPLFREAGFGVYRRLFMDLPLREADARGINLTDPGLSDTEKRERALAAAGFELRSWKEADFAPAGSLIAHAYEGHLDSTINDQYRSVAGSLRFLRNIIRFPGCGVFDAQASRVLVDRASGALAGLLLCSRVREDVAHVTQLCVAARARGAGYGVLLLEVAARALGERGFRKMSLTVTSGNDRAAALYRRVGFTERHTFDAMVWTSLRAGDGPQTPTRP